MTNRPPRAKGKANVGAGRGTGTVGKGTVYFNGQYPEGTGVVSNKNGWALYDKQKSSGISAFLKKLAGRSDSRVNAERQEAARRRLKN